MVSTFYYLRNNLDVDKLKIDDEIRTDMFFDGENYGFKIKYLGKETLRTAFGKVECFVFRPYVMAGRVFKEEESLTLWVSAETDFLVSISPLTDTIEYHHISVPNNHTKTSIDISSIVETANGTLWIGTKNLGLLHFNPRSGQVRQFKHNPEDANSLSSNAVSSMLSDEQRKNEVAVCALLAG